MSAPTLGRLTALLSLLFGALLLSGCWDTPLPTPTLVPRPATPTAPTKAAPSKADRASAPTGRAAEKSGPSTAGAPAQKVVAKPAEKAAAKPGDKPGAAAAVPRDLRRVSVYLPTPAKTIALFPLAISGDLGYLKDAGLDVALETMDASVLVVQQLATLRGDAGLAAADAAMSAFAQGEKLVAVHELRVQPAFRLIVPADSRVQTYADLRGTEVGVTSASGTEVAELRADFAIAGLTVGTDVRLVTLGEELGAVWPRVTSGRVAAYHTSVLNLARLEAIRIQVRAIDPKNDDKERRPSMPLLIRKEVLDREPALAIGLGRAINKAIVFAHANPDAALAIHRKVQSSEHTDPTFARAYMKQAIEMVWRSESGELGEQSLKGWRDLQKVLITAGSLARDFSLDPFVTNELIREMNSFDRRKIEDEAKASKLTYP